MLKTIKRWYNGSEKITKGESGTDYVFMPAPYTDFHWSALIARAFVNFYLKYWQWVWATTVAVFGIYVAYLAIPVNCCFAGN